jgi:hypothetical protein
MLFVFRNDAGPGGLLLIKQAAGAVAGNRCSIRNEAGALSQVLCGNGPHRCDKRIPWSRQGDDIAVVARASDPVPAEVRRYLCARLFSSTEATSQTLFRVPPA